MSSSALDGRVGAIYRELQSCSNTKLPEVYGRFVRLLGGKRGATSAIEAQGGSAGKTVRRRLRNARLID